MTQPRSAPAPAPSHTSILRGEWLTLALSRAPRRAPPPQAARSALDTAIPSAYARKLTETHAARLAKLQADLPALLFEGVLDEDFLMTNQAGGAPWLRCAPVNLMGTSGCTRLETALAHLRVRRSC